MNKTFAELGYNVGDTVRCVCKEYVLVQTNGEPTTRGGYNGLGGEWELVSRAGSTDADDEYQIWADMTPEAQGALLLAEHNGKIIEDFDGFDWGVSAFSGWYDHIKYRVKPAEPVVVTHELFGQQKSFWRGPQAKSDTHKMSYNTIDDVIDCASVKMMEINK
jgi:hypothetical protein